jgi:predicted dehydrogenase
MAKLRVATIGGGAIAQALHLPGYHKNPHAVIAAVTDPDRARWKEIKDKFGVERFYTDYREMLDKESLDAVSVCSPNVFHAEQALAAIDRGLHVLCEKPMTLTEKESARVVAAAKRAKRTFMVGFSHRLMRGNREAKKLLDSGRLGEPFMLYTRFAHQGPFPGWAKSDWFYKPALAGGGALLDMGIHAFDLARFFFGDVKKVSASVKTIVKPIAVDDNAVVTLEFASGALGYIDVGWTSLPGFTGTMLYCRRGNIIIDYREGMRLITGTADPGGRHKVKTKDFKFRPGEGGWSIEMGYFLDCIRKHRSPEMDAPEGAAAVTLALAAYKSAKTGKQVTIR